MKLIKQIRKSWKTYKYRFVPWMKINMADKVMMTVLKSKAISDEKLLEQLQNVFIKLEKSTKSNKNAAIEDIMGFQLSRKVSTMTDAGTGVFISKGIAKKGQIVAIYPGTVYFPSDFIFFQSIANQYIFSCSDKIRIDGKHYGLSKFIYNSCSYRDKVGCYDTSDRSWQGVNLVCPLNIGQFVNNKTKNHKANVMYQELDISKDFSVKLRKFIPNVNINGLHSTNFLRMVVLVALCDIYEGEEVLSDYFTIIKS